MKYRLLFLLIVLALAACGGATESTQEASPAEAQQIQESSLPNLVIANVDGALVVLIPAGQDAISIDYGMVVTNQGTAIETIFSNMIVLLPDDKQFDAGRVGELGTEQSIFLTVSVVFDRPGEFIIQFATDSDGDIDESNENDNSFSLSVSVEKE